MPQFYGSQRLFWYLIVAMTLNSASLVVLTYFLYMRAKAGSTAVYHFLGLFERCLPAWWKEKRLAAERESVAQLVTSAIALGYLLHSLTLISGPALFDDNDPSVRKGGVPSTWPCSVVGAFEQYFSLLSVGCAGFLAPYMSHKLVVQHTRPDKVARRLGSRITLISTVAFAVTACVLLLLFLVCYGTLASYLTRDVLQHRSPNSGRVHHLQPHAPRRRSPFSCCPRAGREAAALLGGDGALLHAQHPSSSGAPHRFQSD